MTGPVTHSPSRHRPRTGLFLAILLALYAAAAATSEFRVARAGEDTAQQRLFAAREAGTVDWVVLGSSHALPLLFGGVPERVSEETGGSMLVLAEIGAGPLYALFTERVALRELEVGHVLYVLDDFAFLSETWNEDRLADRTLLRGTPLTAATAGEIARLVTTEGVSPRALADHLTGFSKINRPEWFPPPGWEGPAAFDRRYRPSRSAAAARVAYLYPGGTPRQETLSRNLGRFEALVAEAREAGAEVIVVRLPLPDAFRDALPAAPDLEAALGADLDALGVSYHDLSGALGAPEFYFDTDHLNRAGVEALWSEHLRAILVGE